MSTMNDELLAHHVTTIKHANSVGGSVGDYLDTMKAIVRKRVAGFDSERRTAERLQKMIEELAKEIKVPAGEYRKELRRQLKELAKYEATYQAETIGKWIDVELTIPSVSAVWSAAKFEPMSLNNNPIDFDDLIDKWGGDEVSRLVMGVKTGFVDGLPVKQIIKTVVGAGGLADISKRNAESIAQTLVMQTANAARFQTYKANNDIIIGYHLINTLDSKTTPICRAWDPKKVYKFTDEYQPKPTFHYRCRTTTIPALSSKYSAFDKGGKRASATGQVDADTTYYGWLKKQPAAYQNEVLGKTKGLIFRNSGLSAEEFRKLSMNSLGKPLTIDQMISTDKRVAEYLQ